MTNHFIENSINTPNRCGWVDCNNVSEPGSGRCEMHKRAENNAKLRKLTPKQRLVYEAIKEHPESANNDAVLLAAVWYKEGWDETLDLEDNLKRVTRPETLSRRRRELFNLGLIKYSPKAMKSRETAYRSERDKGSPIPPEVKSWPKLPLPEDVTQEEVDAYDREVANYEQTRLI